MNFKFPVFIDLGGKPCVVTGAGPEVPPKVEALVNAGAEVRYIHPEAEARIAALALSGRIEWVRRHFESSDLDNCFMVIGDTNNNNELFRLAEERHVLCNCVDDPEHCRFSFGSLHRRGELTIAISTNGWAPAVAVRLKEWLQREIGPEYEILLALLKKIRPQISSRVRDSAARRDLWYEIVDSDVLKLLRAGNGESAEALVGAMIEAASSTSHSDTSHDDADQ